MTLPRFLAGVFLAAACGKEAIPPKGEGLDVSALPQQIRDDYEVFANRCSKCHSLSRPLSLASREASDEFWDRYVARMRRQPGSGISADDGLIVRRFLHFYSRAELARRQEFDAGPPDTPQSGEPAIVDGGAE